MPESSIFAGVIVHVMLITPTDTETENVVKEGLHKGQGT
jgi:hypothetical protein